MRLREHGDEQEGKLREHVQPESELTCHLFSPAPAVKKEWFPLPRTFLNAPIEIRAYNQFVVIPSRTAVRPRLEGPPCARRLSSLSLSSGCECIPARPHSHNIFLRPPLRSGTTGNRAWFRVAISLPQHASSSSAQLPSLHAAAQKPGQPE